MRGPSFLRIIYRVCQKNLTKVMGYNFACVESFLMKFGYVIDIGCKFFHKKFQCSNSKNDKFIEKNRFYNVYIVCAFITPLLKLKYASKFEEMFLNYLWKDPESFIKLSQKTVEICVFAQTIKNSFAMSTFVHSLLRI